jgi:hypothetical protein
MLLRCRFKRWWGKMTLWESWKRIPDALKWIGSVLAGITLVYTAYEKLWDTAAGGHANVMTTTAIAPATIQASFKPVELSGIAIPYNGDNRKFEVWVFYRPERQKDAEKIVGALRSAGYQSEGQQSNLNEVVAPNRNPDATLVKTTSYARLVVEDVFRLVQLAIPVKAPSASVFPKDAPLQQGHIQISLF